MPVSVDRLSAMRLSLLLTCFSTGTAEFVAQRACILAQQRARPRASPTSRTSALARRSDAAPGFAAHPRISARSSPAQIAVQGAQLLTAGAPGVVAELTPAALRHGALISRFRTSRWILMLASDSRRLRSQNRSKRRRIDSQTRSLRMNAGLKRKLSDEKRPEAMMSRASRCCAAVTGFSGGRGLPA